MTGEQKGFGPDFEYYFKRALSDPDNAEYMQELKDYLKSRGITKIGIRSMTLADGTVVPGDPTVN